MRWPFRTPHVLTTGMHEVQRGLSRVVRGCNLDWLRFAPNPAESSVMFEGESSEQVLVFGCLDGDQALVWLLRDCRQNIDNCPTTSGELIVHGLEEGKYIVQAWETYTGSKQTEEAVFNADGLLRIAIPEFGQDVAVTVAKAAPSPTHNS